MPLDSPGACRTSTTVRRLPTKDQTHPILKQDRRLRRLGYGHPNFPAPPSCRIPVQIRGCSPIGCGGSRRRSQLLAAPPCGQNGHGSARRPQHPPAFLSPARTKRLSYNWGQSPQHPQCPNHPADTHCWGKGPRSAAQNQASSGTSTSTAPSPSSPFRRFVPACEAQGQQDGHHQHPQTDREDRDRPPIVQESGQDRRNHEPPV